MDLFIGLEEIDFKASGHGACSKNFCVLGLEPFVLVLDLRLGPTIFRIHVAFPLIQVSVLARRKISQNHRSFDSRLQSPVFYFKV